MSFLSATRTLSFFFFFLNEGLWAWGLGDVKKERTLENNSVKYGPVTELEQAAAQVTYTASQECQENKTAALLQTAALAKARAPQLLSKLFILVNMRRVSQHLSWQQAHICYFISLLLAKLARD